MVQTAIKSVLSWISRPPQLLLDGCYACSRTLWGLQGFIIFLILKTHLRLVHLVETPEHNHLALRVHKWSQRPQREKWLVLPRLPHFGSNTAFLPAVFHNWADNDFRKDSFHFFAWCSWDSKGDSDHGIALTCLTIELSPGAILTCDLWLHSLWSTSWHLIEWEGHLPWRSP